MLGICMTVSGWVYMVPQSIATAASTRVANALGAGLPRAAKVRRRRHTALAATVKPFGNGWYGWWPWLSVFRL